MQEALTSLQGTEMKTGPLQSSRILTWKDSERHSGTFTPFVLEGLPVDLWGWDILSHMSVMIYTPSSSAPSIMFNQGYSPGQGVGISGQGRLEPVQTIPKTDRSGLGYPMFL